MAPVSGATLASHQGASWQLYLAEFGIPGWPATAIGGRSASESRYTGVCAAPGTRYRGAHGQVSRMHPFVQGTPVARGGWRGALRVQPHSIPAGQRGAAQRTRAGPMSGPRHLPQAADRRPRPARGPDTEARLRGAGCQLRPDRAHAPHLNGEGRAHQATAPRLLEVGWRCSPKWGFVSAGTLVNETRRYSRIGSST